MEDRTIILTLKIHEFPLELTRCLLLWFLKGAAKIKVELPRSEATPRPLAAKQLHLEPNVAHKEVPVAHCALGVHVHV